MNINLVGLRVESIDGSLGTVAAHDGKWVTVAWDSAPDHPLTQDTDRYPLIINTTGA